MKIGDTDRVKAADLTDGGTLYRIKNAGGVPYSIAEDSDGEETFSCEQQDEWSLFKRKLIVAVRWYVPQTTSPKDGLTKIEKAFKEMCK